jgi:hypothetical protein
MRTISDSDSWGKAGCCKSNVNSAVGVLIMKKEIPQGNASSWHNGSLLSETCHCMARDMNALFTP